MSGRSVGISGGEEDGPESGSSRRGRRLIYSGWVYHLGVNSVGHEYCHLRYLTLKDKYIAMYKRNPNEDHRIKPIRKGVISHALKVEDMGRRKIGDGDVYVLRFYNRLDETKKGEIAFATAGEMANWLEVFDKAKQQAVYEITKGGSKDILTTENELNLEGHRPRVRRYAHGMKNLIRNGKGPEILLRKTSNLGRDSKNPVYYQENDGDAIETHNWKCVQTINGIRIFEDITYYKGGKSFIVKAVGIVDASVDTVFETVISIDKQKRYEWDMITADLELVESVDGHYDIVYGTYKPNHLSWWKSKTDFVFIRQWFRGQDGGYTILQSPVHKKKPPRSSYKRIKINSSIWEIRRISTPQSNIRKCQVTQMLEINRRFWDRWKSKSYSNFEKTVPFAMLSQVAGLKEYFQANPSLAFDSSLDVFGSTSLDTPTPGSDLDSQEVEEFYDAIANDESINDEDSDGDDENVDDNGVPIKGRRVTLKNVSWAIASFSLKRRKDTAERSELDFNIPSMNIDLNGFRGSVDHGKDSNITNCWAEPSGIGFMIRGKTYLSDYAKVSGGDPLLKLIAVDWLKSENCINQVAQHTKCLVQSETAKKLPFILAINLQIPAKPNYSLVMYYGADRPVRKDSLLGRFIDGSDAFRDARFKLIPSIVEGYWMVKRAVGTKACLLGKAVTCNYIRQDNFLEIDVDIGSSSVARSIIGLVLGYVTSLVVDLAILIEAKEDSELPEYVLGTVRLYRLKPESAVPF
ncbi:ENHANCED DISEASE RESISTANCE protein (DUF1336) [Wolffia australiana]